MTAVALAAIEVGEHAAGHVAGPDRLVERAPVAGDRQDRQQRQTSHRPHPGIVGRVDDRGREDGRRQLGSAHRVLGERLGPEEAGALDRGCPDRREEDEAVQAGGLRAAQQARCGEPVELLHPGVRLIADRRREVDHGADAAQRPADHPGVGEVGEVAEHDPNLDPQPTQATRVADQHPHLLASLEQLRQQLAADGPRRSSNQDHGGNSKMLGSLAGSAPCGRVEAGRQTTERDPETWPT